MCNQVLTEETMKKWLKAIYLNEADEHRNNARNCHLFALGSRTQASAILWEEHAEEHREFASILEGLAKELELED